MRTRGSSASNAAPTASPEMTILEAADVMERLHDSKVLVERAGRPIGFLTERDIIDQVLARGGRPERVTVWEVMSRTWDEPERRSPSLQLDEGTAGGSFLRGAQVYQGKCEECGVLSVDLSERDGLLICTDCSDARTALAYS